mmetsp:Transcript_83297/g.156762  ORF Transcript_83297/g.156762 Transcript_83297/m.156762 type:complete len:159 (+) Transcript_83297:219-695(+)
MIHLPLKLKPKSMELCSAVGTQPCCICLAYKRRRYKKDHSIAPSVVPSLASMLGVSAVPRWKSGEAKDRHRDIALGACVATTAKQRFQGTSTSTIVPRARTPPTKMAMTCAVAVLEHFRSQGQRLATLGSYLPGVSNVVRPKARRQVAVLIEVFCGQY